MKANLKRSIGGVILNVGGRVGRVVGVLTLGAVFLGSGLSRGGEPAMVWWKGNLHTHSFWSDGDDYPEMIADWYKRHGYNFLALSDHNVLSQGERWIAGGPTNGGGGAVLEKYRGRFGTTWVQTRLQKGKVEVRLKPLAEFRPWFEEPRKFLLIQSEEITDKFESRPVHLNATHIRDLIKPQGGTSVVDVIERDFGAVLKQRKRTGQPMIPHLNHPNFGYAITAEDLLQVRSDRFFEIYNGHPSVHNEGDPTHTGVERVWDILLADRLSDAGGRAIYGLAVDDAHDYHQQGPKEANPGRGWVMVRSAFLTPEQIVRAMEAGDFYCSTGVTLTEVERSASGLRIGIEGEPGVTYRTQFIGTKRGYDRRSEPVLNSEGKPLPVTRRYSERIGEIWAEVEGLAAAYTFGNDDLYVRGRVISSKKKVNPYRAGEFDQAWTQPAVAGGAR